MNENYNLNRNEGLNKIILESKSTDVISSVAQVDGCRRYSISREIESKNIVDNSTQNTLIIMDTSSSMLQVGTELVRKIVPNVKKMVERILSQNSQSKICIITFGGYNGTIEDDTNYSLPFTSNLSEINNVLNEIYAGNGPYFVGGSTDIDAALKRAASILYEAKLNGFTEHNMNVFLFTDGGGNMDTEGNLYTDEVLNNTISSAEYMKGFMPEANYLGLSLLNPSEGDWELNFTNSLFNAYIPKENQIIIYGLSISDEEIQKVFDKVTIKILSVARIVVKEIFAQDIVSNFILGTFLQSSGTICSAVKVNNQLIPVSGVTSQTHVNPDTGITASLENNNTLIIDINIIKGSLDKNIIEYQIAVKSDNAYKGGSSKVIVTNGSTLDIYYIGQNNTQENLGIITIPEIMPPLKVDAGVDIEVGKNKSIILGGNPTATGGTKPYTYLWQDLNTGKNIISESEKTKANPIINLDSEDLESLDIINFKVTVTDKYGCEREGQASLNLKESINQPPRVEILKASDLSRIVKEVGSSVLWSIQLVVPPIISKISSITVLDTINPCLNIVEKVIKQESLTISYTDKSVGNKVKLVIDDASQIQSIAGKIVIVEIKTTLTDLSKIPETNIIPNQATVYLNNNIGEKTSNKVEVSVESQNNSENVKLTLNKVESETKLPMSNIKFNLYNVNDRGIKKLIATLQTDFNGVVSYTFNKEGTYYLAESKISGYTSFNEKIYFKVVAKKNPDGDILVIKPSVQEVDGKYKFSDEGILLTIENKKSSSDNILISDCNCEIYYYEEECRCCKCNNCVCCKCSKCCCNN